MRAIQVSWLSATPPSTPWAPLKSPFQISDQVPSMVPCSRVGIMPRARVNAACSSCLYCVSWLSTSPIRRRAAACSGVCAATAGSTDCSGSAWLVSASPLAAGAADSATPLSSACWFLVHAPSRSVTSCWMRSIISSLARGCTSVDPRTAASTWPSWVRVSSYQARPRDRPSRVPTIRPRVSSAVRTRACMLS